MKYFSIEELIRSAKAKELGIDNTPTEDVIANLTMLVENVLDKARIGIGAPIIVNSGYRCEELNKAVGGAKNSQHTKGEAADITTGTFYGNMCLFNYIKDNLEFDQLIDEKHYQWVHVSFRKGRNRKEVLYNQ